MLNQRCSFERGEFLSASFTGQARSRLSARVVEHAQRRTRSEELDRYLQFLTYWGGCPDAIPNIQGINEQTFAVFGVDKKKLSSNVLAAMPVPSPMPTSTPEPTASEPVVVAVASLDPLEAKWHKALEDWSGGKDLPQGDANFMRRWIAEALHGMIDWDWDLFRPLKSSNLQAWYRHVYIPRSGGGDGRGPAESMISVCTEEDLNSPVEQCARHECSDGNRAVPWCAQQILGL